MNRVEFVVRALNDAYQEKSKLTDEVLSLPAMSSKKTRHLLNNLCAFDGCHYLEVGAWKGASLCAAGFRNSCRVSLVENYSESPDGVRAALRSNLVKFIPQSQRWCILEEDFFRNDLLNCNVSKNVNVCFYDACHTYAAQYNAIHVMLPLLADEFVLLIDDFAWKHVRDATTTALSECKLTVLFSACLVDVWDPIRRDRGSDLSPVTGLPSGYVTTVYPEGWWNRVYLAVCRKGAT